MLTTRTFVFLGLLTVFIGACTSTPKEDEKESSKNASEVAKPAETIAPLSEIDILRLRIAASKKSENWQEYVLSATELWQKSGNAGDADNQAAIEYQIFQTLKRVSPNVLSNQALDLQEGEAHTYLENWSTLIKITQLERVWQETALNDLRSFEYKGLFQHHLLPELINHLKQQATPEQIAVMLPFKGPYHNVSRQIRNGIIKHQLRSHPELIIRFYDTSEDDQVVNAYQQAVLEGAERIIGPLRKSAIAMLNAHKAKNLIVLNQVNNTPFTQFAFNSPSEGLQIATKLAYRNHKTIGVLTNDKPKNSKLAVQIHQAWEQEPDQRAVYKAYPKKNPQLRKAIADVINITQSQARKNNLKWLLGQKLQFNPRARQDLDAIVIVGGARNMAVFQPQMAFFEVDIPLYASAGISPSDYQTLTRNKDLKNVVFPTANAVINTLTKKHQDTTNQVDSAFEAFGWDSLIVALHPDFIVENLCYTKGKKGCLTRVGQVIDTQLAWAMYDKRGRLKPLPAPEPVCANQNP